jgi:GAF domain-containing protein
MTPTTSDQPNRETLISETFLRLADTLVEDFDIIDMLTTLADRTVELVDTQAAGILLADANDGLHVVAASSEQARLLELFQLQSDEGPCLEAYKTGRAVIVPELRTTLDRWPRFTPYAVGAGFESVCALPLRLRGAIIGALNLFHVTSDALPAADIDLAQALGDIASIAILQARAAAEAQLHGQHLQHALDSRIVIEQAKGMIAQLEHTDMDAAFMRIRAHARNTNTQLTVVAAAIVNGELTLDQPATRSARRRS